MSEPRTPQVPMIDGDGKPFYPLTQYNQIVMPGGGRWDGNPGSSVELDATLKEAGKAADAKATGDALNELKNEKVDKAGWTAGKNVVTDADGNLVTEDKPTIPTIPSALPNPFAVTINGQSYDGSEEVEMTVSGIPDGGTAGQVLSKKSDANQDVEWKDPQGGSANDYSGYETEKAIGKWIDGKTIYRRSFTGTCSASGDHTIVTSEINYTNSRVVSLIGFVGSKWNNEYVIPLYLSDSDRIQFYVQPTGIHLVFGTSVQGFLYQIVVDYIKL